MYHNGTKNDNLLRHQFSVQNTCFGSPTAEVSHHRPRACTKCAVGPAFRRSTSTLTTMETHLQVLHARRKILASTPSTTPAAPSAPTAPQPDPFSFESHGFFLPSVLPSDSASPNSTNRNPLSPHPHTARTFQSSAARRNNASKATKKRQRRFVTNWTPEMDKVVRKALAKYGWGSWTRIASSGKLPKEYNAKLIANRARAIGLTKQMFGPQVVPTISKAKS